MKTTHLKKIKSFFLLPPSRAVSINKGRVVPSLIQQGEERPRFFDSMTKSKCWGNAKIVHGRHREKWHKEVVGNIIYKLFSTAKVAYASSTTILFLSPIVPLLPSFSLSACLVGGIHSSIPPILWVHHFFCSAKNHASMFNWKQF